MAFRRRPGSGFGQSNPQPRDTGIERFRVRGSAPRQMRCRRLFAASIGLRWKINFYARIRLSRPRAKDNPATQPQHQHGTRRSQRYNRSQWLAPSPYRQARSGKRTEKRLRHGIGKSSVTGVRSCSQPPAQPHLALHTCERFAHLPQLPISRILKQYRQW